MLKKINSKHIFLIALLLQFFVFVINLFFPLQINYDPWFEIYARKFIEHPGEPIIWGPDGDLRTTTSHLQVGKYFNWRPIGYSLFLSIIYLFGFVNYELVRTIYQALVYSFIPVIFFKICKKYFYEDVDNKKSLVSVLIFMLNPLYLVGFLQSLDTWLKVLVTLSIVLFIFNNDTKSKILLIPFLIFLYLITPIGFLSIVLLIITLTFLKHFSLKYFFSIAVTLTFIIMLFGFRNYYLTNHFDITNSSVGYNLWLGNNEATLEFLKSHLGDGATIEDKIIPQFNYKFKFLEKYSEYEKNKFFKEEAIKFILKHPAITLENMLWKIVGFWSPLRVRKTHYTDSKIKFLLSLIYQTPLLLTFFIMVIRFIIKKEWEINKLKLIMFLLVLFWFIPYLFFFTLARYRTPIEFVFIITFVELIYSLKEKFVISYKRAK